MTYKRPTLQVDALYREAQELLVPDDGYNRALVHQVHPSRWTNPTPARCYNLVVVGGGTAGLVAAVGAASLGAKVALVEEHFLGGDCLNVGCVPSKALLRSARALYEAHTLERFGVKGSHQVHADFAAVMARMRRLRAELAPNDSVWRLRDLGVDVFLGKACFVATDTIEVNGARLRFRRAIIATGSRPSIPPIPGLDRVGFLTNETIFSLTELPRRLVVLGAGPIGCELGQAFRRFGSEVVMVALDPRLLPRDDPEASSLVERQFRSEGIELALGATVRSVGIRGGRKVVTFAIGDGVREIEGDELLVATGREPVLSSLKLWAAGVQFDRHGVWVDEYLRTTNRRIYAAGDVCSRYKFTHAADAMARIALENALFFPRRRVSDVVFPWCTYTDPEVAHVGMTPAEAQAVGDAVAVFRMPLEHVDRAVLDGEPDGFAKLYVEKRSGRVLGATLVARHAGEMIGEMCLAVASRQRAGKLSQTVHPYPTQAEVWRKLGDAWNRTKLTPRLGSVLRRYFAVWRWQWSIV